MLQTSTFYQGVNDALKFYFSHKYHEAESVLIISEASLNEADCDVDKAAFFTVFGATLFYLNHYRTAAQYFERSLRIDNRWEPELHANLIVASGLCRKLTEDVSSECTANFVRRVHGYELYKPWVDKHINAENEKRHYVVMERLVNFASQQLTLGSMSAEPVFEPRRMSYHDTYEWYVQMFDQLSSDRQRVSLALRIVAYLRENTIFVDRCWGDKARKWLEKAMERVESMPQPWRSYYRFRVKRAKNGR